MDPNLGVQSGRKRDLVHAIRAWWFDVLADRQPGARPQAGSAERRCLCPR